MKTLVILYGEKGSLIEPVFEDLVHFSLFSEVGWRGTNTQPLLHKLKVPQMILNNDFSIIQTSEEEIRGVCYQDLSAEKINIMKGSLENIEQATGDERLKVIIFHLYTPEKERVKHFINAGETIDSVYKRVTKERKERQEYWDLFSNFHRIVDNNVQKATESILSIIEEI